MHLAGVAPGLEQRQRGGLNIVHHVDTIMRRYAEAKHFNVDILNVNAKQRCIQNNKVGLSIPLKV